MKLGKLGALLVCISMVGFTACTNKKSSKETKSKTIDTNAIQKNSAGLNASAENLALAAEQLVSPVSFMYADLIFDQALKNNPKNKRSKFYKVILKPLMYLKGSVTRIKPLLPLLTPKHRNEHNQFIKNFPESALKTFLLDGKEDIKNEADIQAFLDGYRKSWEKVRLFMRKNKDLNLDLNIMTMPLMGESMEKAFEECFIKQVEVGIYEVAERCDYSKALKVNVSRADIEVIQQIAAGMQIGSILSTAYNLNGTRKLHELGKNKDLTQKEIIEHYRKSEKAGELRNNELTKISKLGIDAVTGTRWALVNQKSLCVNDETSPKNRKGALFNQGICIDSVESSSGKLATEVLNTISAVINGGLITVKKDIYKEKLLNDQYGSYYSWDKIGTAKAVIKPSALIDSPIADLKTIMPTKYNKCDNAVSLKDSSIGGLFPSKDANKYLKKAGELDVKNCN